MGLKDALALVDDKLEKLFHERKPDPTKERAKFIKGIDRTGEQFHATEPVKGRKWFSVRNSIVKFTPPHAIGGKTDHHIPSERFPDFLKHLRTATEAGELDDVLVSGGTATAGRSRRSSGGGWTPERRARYQATMAAKRKSGK